MKRSENTMGQMKQNRKQGRKQSLQKAKLNQCALHAVVVRVFTGKESRALL